MIDMLGPSDGLPPRKTEPPVYKLISVFVGAFLASGDFSLFLATQDRIAANFRSITYAPLILASFSLGHSIALPLYGILSDRYGCKPVLIHAYLLFALGCAVSGLTSYFPLFLFGRLISGVGGAGMLDIFMVLICELYNVEAVTRLRGYIMTTSILGRSCGGPIGGLLTDYVGWRWSLAGQTPIAIACAFSAWWLLPAGNTDKQPAYHERTLLQNLDVPGIALLTVCMGSAVLVLDLGGQTIPWNHPLVSFSATFGCLSGVALFINEWKRKGIKLLPPDLLLRPGLRSVYVGQILFNCAIDGILSSLGPYFAWTERLSATATAVRLWPQALGGAAGALTASQMISRTQTHTKTSIIGALVSAFSYLLMSVQWADGIDGAEIGYTLTMGVGSGMFCAGQFEALIENAPAGQRATATGLYYLCQQVGGILGTALMASLTQGFFRRELLAYTVGIASVQRQKFVEMITRGPRYVDAFPNSVQTAVKECYQHAYSHAIMTSTIRPESAPRCIAPPAPIVGTGSATQTIATCCPEAFTCQTSTHWPWFKTEACEKKYDPNSTYTMSFIDTDGKSRTTTTTGIGINAFGIGIRNGGNGSLPPSVSASPTPTQPGTASDDDGSLSEGAKTGIGVGVGVGGFFVLLLAALLFWRWRHPRANQGNATSTGEDQRPEFRSELPGVSEVKDSSQQPGVWNTKGPTELEVPPAEMPTGNQTTELEGRPVAELDVAPARTPSVEGSS